MNNPTQPTLLPPTKFLHYNPQSKGGLGKSLEVELRCTWLDRHGIEWRGSDLDDRHRTFFDRHPGAVDCYKLGNAQDSKGTFITLFRSVLREPTPLHVVDSRAQADELFMTALEELNFFHLCREQGVRVVFFLFPSDELESMKNFRTLVQYGAKQVNYVVVDNPAKGGSKLFQGSPIQKSLENMGAKTIRLPAISTTTMLSMERAEAKAGRGISFGEFASPNSGHLEVIMAGELQWVLGRMYAQYDAIADLLLPPDLAAKVQSARAGDTPKKKPQATEENFGFNFED